ncbi:MAG: hypothetical protein NT156_06090 [Mycobacterium sp.]|nr:hypothetical protein [Mycobacterium sp.]
MNSSTRPFALTGVALATVGALIATTPAAIGNAAAPTPEPTPVAADIGLLSHSKGGGWKVKGDVYVGYFGVGSFDDDDDDDDDEYQGNGHSDDDDDDDRDGWGGGGFGSFVTDFLANNQAEVIAVTAMIPVFNIGPVAVGNSLLANAYYDGYNGSATGVDGVVSYVTSQIGVPPADLVQGLVLGATSLVPRFNLGPVAVGNSLLATAYFSGYNGSATGIPGLVSYVTSQLGIQAPAPVAALKASAVKAGAAAAASIPSVAAARSAVEVAEAGDNSAAGTAKADSVRADRSVSGRVVAKAARAAGQAKASAARATAESAADAR